MDIDGYKVGDRAMLLKMRNSILCIAWIAMSLSSLNSNAVELLTNGDFTAKLKLWHEKSNGGGAESTFEVIQEKPYLQIQVAKAGGHPIDVNLTRQKIDLKAGKTYTVSFLGKSEPDLKVNVVVQQQVKPFDMIGTSQVFDFTSEWKPYTFDFTPKKDEMGRLVFMVGNDIGKYCFKLISLQTPDDTTATDKTSETPPPVTDLKSSPAKPAPAPSSPAPVTNSANSTATNSDYAGSITAIDPVKLTISFTRKTTKLPETFTVNQDTKIIVNGSPAKLADIKIGMQAVFVPATDPLFAESVKAYNK